MGFSFLTLFIGRSKSMIGRTMKSDLEEDIDRSGDYGF